jgi:hypothetical protein
LSTTQVLSARRRCVDALLEELLNACNRQSR